MNGENFGSDQEQNMENPGAGSLEQMPSWDEHIKNFATAKENGEVPEGVRDEQDYNEYQQEKQARLQEAQNFIKSSYYTEGPSANYKQEVSDFLNSKSLRTVVEHGFNLDKMHRSGLIAKYDGELGMGSGVACAFDDTSEIVADLASFCTLADRQENAGDLISAMHDIFRAWDENNLNAPQYDVISRFLPPMAALSRRLIYGEVISEGGRGAENDSIVEHTTHFMHEIPNMENEYGTAKTDALLQTYDFLKGKRLALDSVSSEKLNSAFGKLSHSLLNDLIFHDLDGQEEHWGRVDDVKDIVMKTITCYDFETIKAAKSAQLVVEVEGENLAEYGEMAFSDEELLGAMYDLENSETQDKIYGYTVPRHYLARHFGGLMQAGFSKKSLLKIIHDDEMQLHTEEIEDMRSAGASNTEIAYATNAHKNCYIRDGKRKWLNEDLARFSDTELLDAAIMDNMNQQGWPIQ